MLAHVLVALVGAICLARVFASRSLRLVALLLRTMGPIPRHVAFIMDGNRFESYRLVHPVTPGGMQSSMTSKPSAAILLDLRYPAHRLPYSCWP